MPGKRLEGYLAPSKYQYMSTVIIINLNDEHGILSSIFQTVGLHLSGVMKSN